MTDSRGLEVFIYMKKRKLTGLLLGFVLSVSMSATAFAAPAVTDKTVNTEPTIILHTNEVHCGIDDSIG